MKYVYMINILVFDQQSTFVGSFIFDIYGTLEKAVKALYELAEHRHGEITKGSSSDEMDTIIRYKSDSYGMTAKGYILRGIVK